MFNDLKQLVEKAQKIVILIANNPDADAVGSALGLEAILSDLDKEVSLYCRVNIPFYLHFLEGWDRISPDLVSTYDLAIMVDNSSQALITSDNDPQVITRLRQKPLVILDHHPVKSDIDFAELIINQPELSATGELVFSIAQSLNWPLTKEAGFYLVASILSDSLGFTSQSMTNNSQPLKIVAKLVDLGVDLHDLAQRRIEYQHIPSKIIPFKGQLLKQIEFFNHDQIACLVVEPQDIKDYSHIFNPTIVLDEMRFVDNVKLSLGFKKYVDPSNNLIKVTLRIRCHHNCQQAQTLAQTFGGGGHVYAAGVKWEAPNLNFDMIKQEVLTKAEELLKLESHET